MCGPKRYDFSAVLAINRVTILAILVINTVTVWFLPSSLELGMFLSRNFLFFNIDKTMDKSPSEIMFTAITLL